VEGVEERILHGEGTGWLFVRPWVRVWTVDG